MALMIWGVAREYRRERGSRSMIEAITLGYYIG